MKILTADNLGDVLFQLRAENRMTQKDVYKKCGVSKNTIYLGEKGKKLPNFYTLHLLLETYGYEMLVRRKGSEQQHLD